MKIIISTVLAYLICGICQVTKDLGKDVMYAPVWTMQPTFGKVILAVATWFMRPLLDNTDYSKGVRVFVAGLLGPIIQMAMLTGLVWCCITLSTYIFANVILQIVATAVLLVIGALFVLPIISIPTMLLTLIILLPLDLLFPPKGKTISKISNKLKIQCPKCGKPLFGATSDMIGHIGVCQKCKAEFTITDE